MPFYAVFLGERESEADYGIPEKKIVDWPFVLLRSYLFSWFICFVVIWSNAPPSL